jgi:hypothetical protein
MGRRWEGWRAERKHANPGSNRKKPVRDLTWVGGDCRAHLLVQSFDAQLTHG